MVLRFQQYEARGEIVWHWSASSHTGLKQGSAQTLDECIKAVYALRLPELEADAIMAGYILPDNDTD